MVRPYLMIATACGPFFLSSAPLLAQTKSDTEDNTWQQPADTLPSLPALSGQTPNSGIGKIGQRQSADDPRFNLNPTERISSRIETRIANRLRTRIDPDYDPQANAASVLRESTDRLSKANQTTRR